HQNGQNFLFEAVEVRVHHVQRHLHGIEREAVSKSGLQHLQVDVGTFVASKSDVAQLALLLRFEDGFHPTAFGENAGSIGVANDLVKLHKIYMIGLQAAE